MTATGKERTARRVTIAVLLAALAVAAARQGFFRRSADTAAQLLPALQPKPEPSPQDAIYGMLDAAREGDVRRYLDSYTGPMRAALAQAVAEARESGFAQYLRDSNAPIKGVAITEPQTLSDRDVKVRVEFVYQDRNEAQTMYLEKSGGVWRISRVDAAERVKTLVPYGTPVQ